MTIGDADRCVRCGAGPGNLLWCNVGWICYGCWKKAHPESCGCRTCDEKRAFIRRQNSSERKA